MTPQLRKRLFTVALLASLGGVGAGALAQAQTVPAAQAAHAHGQYDPAKRAERINRHLADLKQKLQLSNAQEPAWTSFSNAMQPQARGQRPDRDAIARMSTPDRIDHMRALRERRNAEMDRKADATKAFYAQLGVEQKKTFDTESARMFSRGQGHKGHQRG